MNIQPANGIPPPTLTIVAGRPGAGKTTLAHALAARIHCPLISRDAIKEGMVNTTGDKGSPGGSLAQDTYTTFFSAVGLLLQNRVTLVAEAFFGQDGWNRHIDRLKALSRVNLIVCEVPLEIASTRIMRRRLDDEHWDEFHNPPVDQTQLPPEHYMPPELGVPTLAVDCSGEYRPGLEEIYRFTRA